MHTHGTVKEDVGNYLSDEMHIDMSNGGQGNGRWDDKEDITILSIPFNLTIKINNEAYTAGASLNDGMSAEMKKDVMQMLELGKLLHQALEHKEYSLADDIINKHVKPLAKEIQRLGH